MEDDIQALRRMAGLVTPMALRVAVTLGLPDRLRADPAHAAAADSDAGLDAADAAVRPAAAATVDRLAAELDVNPMALELLLGHLVTLGVVERTDDGYSTTEFGAHLCADAGNGLHNLLHHDTAAGRADLAFVDLAHSIRTGEPAYPLRYGQDFWADLTERPHLRAAFDGQMTWRIREQVPAFVAAVDWSRFGTIVDVGGGPGDLLAAVLRAHPGVRGHLVDLEIAPASANLGEFGDRAEVTAGSFFDPLPAGDAYVLFDILHDWDDERSGRIIAGIAAAIPDWGRLLVIGAIRGMGAATEMDLVMLVHFGGRERSVEDLQKLAAPHGLALAAVTEVTGGRFVLEFRRHPI